MTATDCLALRALLGEHAVSTLPDHGRREVERHLEWCAGCRKEARELQEGAAIVGLSLAVLEPPAGLEDGVVARVQHAARGGRPGRASRLRRAVTVLAAAVALLAVSLAGVLVAQRQSGPSKARFSDASARATIEHLRSLYRDLRKSGQPSDVSQAVLTSPGGHGGVGGALLVTATASRFPDQLVVLVGGLDRTAGPYRVWLRGSRRGRYMIPGFITPDVGGGGGLAGQLKWSSPDLKRFDGVEVRDRKHRIVLSGSFPRT